MKGYMPVITYLVLINLCSYVFMGWDKLKAIRNSSYRIPEKVLFSFALLGGSIGVFLGMRGFKHKTRHKKFGFGIPIMISLQVFVCIWILEILN